MKNEYDFSGGKVGPVIKGAGKTRITIMLDTDLIDQFRQRAQCEGTGDQTEINRALRAYLAASEPQLTVDILRRVVREEIHAELHAA